MLIYYRNHMGSDKISQEERAEYREKVHKILEKHKAQDLKDMEDSSDEEEKKTEQSGGGSAQKKKMDDEAQLRMNQEKIKFMFDKITEIESNPDGKEAQEYYKRLAELERNSPSKKRKKPATIIIKNMRGSRTLST